MLPGAIMGHYSVLSRPRFPHLLRFQLEFVFLGQKAQGNVRATWKRQTEATLDSRIQGWWGAQWAVFATVPDTSA